MIKQPHKLVLAHLVRAHHGKSDVPPLRTHVSKRRLISELREQWVFHKEIEELEEQVQQLKTLLDSESIEDVHAKRIRERIEQIEKKIKEKKGAGLIGPLP